MPSDPKDTQRNVSDGDASATKPEGVPSPRLFRSRDSLLVVTAVCVVLAATCWLEHRSLRSLAGSLQTRSGTLTAMRADATRIQALSAVPHRATERKRPTDDLLAAVESALQRADIPLDRWQDSVPQPLRQVPDSPYKRLTTRLYLENLTQQQVTAFAHHLLAADPSLTISSLRLSAPRQADHTAWNVDVGVSYLILG